jgi:hypothetical protein
MPSDSTASAYPPTSTEDVELFHPAKVVRTPTVVSEAAGGEDVAGDDGATLGDALGGGAGAVRTADGVGETCAAVMPAVGAAVCPGARDEDGLVIRSMRNTASATRITRPPATNATRREFCDKGRPRGVEG